MVCLLCPFLVLTTSSLFFRLSPFPINKPFICLTYLVMYSITKSLHLLLMILLSYSIHKSLIPIYRNKPKYQFTHSCPHKKVIQAAPTIAGPKGILFFLIPITRRIPKKLEIIRLNSPKIGPI